MKNPREKHWCYPHENKDRFDRIYTACRIMANFKKDIDIQNPTCPTCLTAKTEDDHFRETHSV